MSELNQKIREFREDIGQSIEGLALLMQMEPEDFENWSEITPGFFPDFSKWDSPELKISFKNILRREYSSLFALIFSFTVLDLIGNYLVIQKLYVVPMWNVLFWTTFAAYLILRFLKRHSNFLDVKGR